MRGEIHHIHSDSDTGHPHEAMPRRLMAILAGDISGYSRLMELDEEGTFARVKRIQRDLLEPTIAEHHGRLISTAGDGFIAIFDSPVEAVRCGIVIQQSMVGRNASLPRERWIMYRIGVNLGDVIVEGDDVYGDGVNVAARLENIANPGHIYISGGVYEQVKHKLVCGYQSLGDRQVKNITDPVRVYRVLPDPSALAEGRSHRAARMLTALGIVLLAIAGGAYWYVMQPDGRLTSWFAAPERIPAKIATAPANPPPVAAPNTAPVAPNTAPVAPKPSSPATTAAPAIAPQPVAPSLREPEMIPIQGGSFAMGSNDDISEKPVHRVAVKPFAISKFPVTVREWNDCAAAKACPFVAKGKDDAPVTDVSWNDAKQYVGWLAGVTRKPYRLPSEAEWEYAARGGTQTKYWWGDQFQPGIVNCKGCSEVAVAEQPMTVGSLKPNPFGLHEMGGSIDQWVEDCWHRNYQGAPADGSPWVDGDCALRVLRSGSWRNDARYVRPANRDHYEAIVRYPTHGFRVALSP
jgi:formylglycine-generating enzyme required for sulfatase activity/class 3 adenylate cyclase